MQPLAAPFVSHRKNATKHNAIRLPEDATPAGHSSPDDEGCNARSGAILSLQSPNHYVVDVLTSESLSETEECQTDEFDPPSEVRALIEGQFMSMRGHAERCGLPIPPNRIIATGGASSNQAILKTMASVFGCPVYTVQRLEESRSIKVQSFPYRNRDFKEREEKHGHTCEYRINNDNTGRSPSLIRFSYQR
ncbi:uncharacterized protein LOC119355646 isoform X2 [Triticum dicoccoides]|uniref:uncharacterized protein LOC119355646 isoform X2 n=1 Tax=Triticum dicoccoides TaxID=85692 RepID=UPI00188E9747|nr:uncharacterized protein LOC119355646 isoform X2 [Triticum dicoccoides]